MYIYLCFYLFMYDIINIKLKSIIYCKQDMSHVYICQ